MKFNIIIIAIAIFGQVTKSAITKTVDTLIVMNTSIELTFDFPFYECGINIYKHTKHHSVCSLKYNDDLDTARIKYIPAKDFVGIDTLIYVKGCMMYPSGKVADTVAYVIKVTEGKKVNYKYNAPKCSGIIHIRSDDGLNQSRNNLVTFLKEKGVDAGKTEISYVYGLMENCESCGCLNGCRYYVWVPDYYSETMKTLGFTSNMDTVSNAGYTRLLYNETQCSDPWYGIVQYIIAPTPEERLVDLAGYLNGKGFGFELFEIKLAMDLNKVGFCEACVCGTGYVYEIVVENQYIDSLLSLGFVKECEIKADFDYGILESLPIQIDFISTAVNADSVIWKSISGNTSSDTVFGRGEDVRITNLYDFEVLAPDCVGCPAYITVEQIVFNSCGKDSIYKMIQIKNVVGDHKIKNESRFFICPNPTYGNIEILGLDEFESHTIHIFTMTGQEVYNEIYNGQIVKLNLSKGIYLLNVRNKGSQIFTNRLVIVE